MRIGIDLGGSHIAVGLIDEKGTIILKKEKSFEEEDKKNIEKIIEERVVSNITEILEETKTNIKDIEKIGISAPGTCKDGKIVKAKNLGLENFKIVDILSKHYKDKKISLANDGKCAAMCEKQYGSLKQYDDCIFLCLGTGVGGAVFLDGKLLKSKKYPGFELGHVVIRVDGKKCSCGNSGCIESYCSMKVLKEKIAKRKKVKEISGKELDRILLEDMESVKDIVDEYIKDLCIALANYINIFEPEAISLGGSFAYCGELLLDKITNEIRENKMTFNHTVPKIFVAEHKNDAGIIGAVLI